VKYKVNNLFNRTILYKAISLLPNEDRVKIVFVLIIQIFLGVLDLLGVAILGFIGALSFSGVQSLKPGDKTTELLNYLGIESLSFQTQVAILAATAVFLFIIRTAISIVLLKKCFYFLSRRGAQISTDLFSKLMSSSLITIQERTTQQTLHAITVGVQSISFILGISINLIADLSISIVMIIGLLIVDPLLGLLTTLFLGSIGLILYLNCNNCWNSIFNKRFPSSNRCIICISSSKYEDCSCHNENSTVFNSDQRKYWIHISYL